MKTLRASMIILMALPLLSGSTGNSRSTLCSGFVPKKYEIQIPEGAEQFGGINKADFNRVLDEVEKIYQPIVQAQGGRLVINRLWSDGTVNASAEQIFGDWILNMYGGLARHPSMTADGFALIACHELGHHVGGFPKYASWATNEGGADYYATLKCLRRVLPRSSNRSRATTMVAHNPYAAAKCKQSYPWVDEQNLCQEIAMASIAVADVLAALSGEKMPTLRNQDTRIVDQMDNDHPEPQCRLDTYFQGSLCTKSVGEDLSNDGPEKGACTKSQGFPVGLRPRCWYMPPSPDVEMKSQREPFSRDFETKEAEPHKVPLLSSKDQPSMNDDCDEDTSCCGLGCPFPTFW